MLKNYNEPSYVVQGQIHDRNGISDVILKKNSGKSYIVVNPNMLENYGGSFSIGAAVRSCPSCSRCQRKKIVGVD